MTILHILSWLAFLAIIPATAAILFIKNRSAVATWIRTVQHPDRWLLSATLPKDSSPQQIHATLKEVVSQTRNSEWDASCTYKRRDHSTGEWIIGSISNAKPIDTEVPAALSFSRLPSAHVIRVSGQPRDEGDTVKKQLQHWVEKNDIPHSRVASSLAAQSFQCWEWEITDSSKLASLSFLSRISETIFEMRDILAYPILFTVIPLIMCGTGSPWLFGIGIFTIILMSGACKFVFLHQREDITQESHLQNY